MTSLLLTGGRVIDPANRLDASVDVLVVEGKIAAVSKDAAQSAPPNVERLEVNGLVVCPGMIDLHVHFREPGQTQKPREQLALVLVILDEESFAARPGGWFRGGRLRFDRLHLLAQRLHLLLDLLERRFHLAVQSQFELASHQREADRRGVEAIADEVRQFLEGGFRKACAGGGWSEASRIEDFLPVDRHVLGGIDAQTAPLAVKAGANVLVAGSSIFHAADGVAAAMARLRQVL